MMLFPTTPSLFLGKVARSDGRVFVAFCCENGVITSSNCYELLRFVLPRGWDIKKKIVFSSFSRYYIFDGIRYVLGRTFLGLLRISSSSFMMSFICLSEMHNHRLLHFVAKSWFFSLVTT